MCFTFHPLRDLFIPIPIRRLWRAAITARRLFKHISTTVYRHVLSRVNWDVVERPKMLKFRNSSNIRTWHGHIVHVRPTTSLLHVPRPCIYVAYRWDCPTYLLACATSVSHVYMRAFLWCGFSFRAAVKSSMARP